MQKKYNSERMSNYEKIVAQYDDLFTDPEFHFVMKTHYEKMYKDALKSLDLRRAKICFQKYRFYKKLYRNSAIQHLLNDVNKFSQTPIVSYARH